MRFSFKLMLAAGVLAMPLMAGAQAPPGPVPPVPEQNPPAWGQRMGPRGGMQQGMGPGMGMRQGMMGQRMGTRQRMGMHRGMGPRGLALGRMLQNPQVRERLKITPEQMAKIQAQESAAAKAGIRNRADLQVKEMELSELIRADKPDRTQIDKKLRELIDASFVARKAAIDNQLAMRELFTPEQRQEMEKMREEFRGRMMQRWMGGGAPGGRGPRAPRPMNPPQPPAPPDTNGK